MKKLNNFIQEKLIINKNIKTVNKINEKNIDIFTDELCKYFQKIGKYKNIIYKTKFEILNKYFKKNLSLYFNYYIMDFCQIVEKITDSVNNEQVYLEYIDKNNDEIYDIIKDFVL